MNKYRIIKRLLICLVLVTMTATIICLCLLIQGKISVGLNNLVISINTLATMVLALFVNITKRQGNTINAPEYKVNARIIGKRQLPPSKTNPFGLPQDGSCFINFAFQNGFVIELSTPADAFLSLKEGQYGVLTFKQKEQNFWFVSFESH